MRLYKLPPDGVKLSENEYTLDAEQYVVSALKEMVFVYGVKVKVVEGELLWKSVIGKVTEFVVRSAYMPVLSCITTYKVPEYVDDRLVFVHVYTSPFAVAGP